jgi:hypothetical protein
MVNVKMFYSLVIQVVIGQKAYVIIRPKSLDAKGQ